MSALTITREGATLRRSDTGETITLPEIPASVESASPQGLAWSWIAAKLVMRTPMDAVEMATREEIAEALRLERSDAA